MYIAFKWLVGLAICMWIATCCIDAYIKKDKQIKGTGFTITTGYDYKNVTMLKEKQPKLHSRQYKPIVEDSQNGAVIFHYIMFFAGGLAVSVFNRKREIIRYTKNKVIIINISLITMRRKLMESIKEYDFKIIVANMRFVMLKYINILWVNIRLTVNRLRKILKMRRNHSSDKLNLILIKRLKEIGEERKSLGQLLIAAIHENKNIKIQHQLETMAKNRLVRRIEDTQKLIKENRSRYVSYQHLYLVTHKENTFLKARIKKLSKEKEDAERNLMCLVNEVYQSKNHELKAYCSKLIVQTKDTLLNSNMNAEIQKFLHKSRGSASTSDWQIPEQPVIEAAATDSLTSTFITEVSEDEDSMPLVPNAPKLRGLPGECVWTVKDKDGVIEKLYEYDCETDLDNGDIIRRIREYSVYYDKDCLLDYSSSRTGVRETISDLTGVENRYITRKMDYPLANRRFLTGSEVFQKFLRNNNNAVTVSKPPAPPFRVLC